MNLKSIDRVFFGRTEVPVTVFVPWDCNNNCKFCTTKHEYKTLYTSDKLQQNLENVKKSIKQMTSNDFVTDVVFTGGEPFERLDLLMQLIDEIQGAQQVFVNTSFTISDKKFKEAMTYLRSKRNKIDSVSVSCPFNGFSNFKRIHQLADFKDKKFFRINAIVNGNETQEDILKFLDDYFLPVFRELNFRADYRKIKQSSLHSANDKFFKTLMSIAELKYTHFTGCLVCRTDVFQSKYGHVIYHRGINDTSMKFGDALVVNDFVIKQDGEIRFDWNSKCKMTDELFESFDITVE